MRCKTTSKFIERLMSEGEPVKIYNDKPHYGIYVKAYLDHDTPKDSEVNIYEVASYSDAARMSLPLDDAKELIKVISEEITKIEKHIASKEAE